MNTDSKVLILVDGESIEARPGESVAAALLRNGRRILRRTRGEGAPRGLFCGIGSCYDCLVTVDGVSGRRACMVPVRPGLRVDTGGPAA